MHIYRSKLTLAEARFLAQNLGPRQGLGPSSRPSLGTQACGCRLGKGPQQDPPQQVQAQGKASPNLGKPKVGWIQQKTWPNGPQGVFAQGGVLDGGREYTLRYKGSCQGLGTRLQALTKLFVCFPLLVAHHTVCPLLLSLILLFPYLHLTLHFFIFKCQSMTNRELRRTNITFGLKPNIHCKLLYL